MSLEGRLEDLSLADIFQIIHLSKKTGVLTVENSTCKGRIVFHSGQILYASLQNREKLGERLIKEGLIQEKDLEMALRIQKERKMHEPLGSILAENKFVDKNALEGILQEQLKEVVYELLSWADGSFKFEPEKAVPELPIGGSLSPEYLLLEGSRLMDEDGKLTDDRKEMISPHSSFVEEKDLAKTLISFIEEIAIPVVSTEGLLMVLRFTGEVMNRAVLFIIRGGNADGFGQVGLSLNAADQKIKGLRVPLDKPSVIRDVVGKKGVYKGVLSEAVWNNYLVTHIGEGVPAEVFVAPVIEGDKVIAVIYGDNLPHRRSIGDTAALEAFIKVAGIVYLASNG